VNVNVLPLINIPRLRGKARGGVRADYNEAALEILLVFLEWDKVKSMRLEPFM
jgi:hypothetical protein